MPWSTAELEAYQRDGFLLQRGLLPGPRIAALMQRMPAILAGDDADGCHREREHVGSVRQVYLAHRHDPLFAELVRDPLLLAPVQDLLGADLHIYHSKINVKAAVSGGVWLWHQDYGYWFHDGVAPRLMSVMVLLERASMHNGALMVVAGSHRWGRLEHVADTVTTSYRQWCVEPKRLREVLREDDIRLITGEPGDVLFFDCNLLHGSGHNLSPHDRTSFIVVYNQLANPPSAATPRPDWVVDRTLARVE